MAKFRDIKTLQKLVAVHASTHNYFYHQCHLNRRDIINRPNRRFDPMVSTCSPSALNCRSYTSEPVSLTMPFRWIRASNVQ